MMKNLMSLGFVIILASCAGVKVIHPNDKNKNAGTLMMDENGKLVKTYTCRIVASNGKRVEAVDKSEKAAREEVLARCRDKTIISACLPKNVKCIKN